MLKICLVCLKWPTTYKNCLGFATAIVTDQLMLLKLEQICLLFSLNKQEKTLSIMKKEAKDRSHILKLKKIGFQINRTVGKNQNKTSERFLAPLSGLAGKLTSV